MHAKGQELRVPLPPPVSHHMQGGIGLADLEEYLETTKSPITSSDDDITDCDLEIEEALEDEERVMPCTVMRAGEPM